MREDHCFDVAESLGNTGGDKHGACCDNGRGEEERAETAVFEIELPFEVICHP